MRPSIRILGAPQRLFSRWGTLPYLRAIISVPAGPEGALPSERQGPIYLRTDATRRHQSQRFPRPPGSAALGGDGESASTLAHKLKNLVIGRRLRLHDPTLFHRLSLVVFFAWVGLGVDGLSSSCYGPEETFLALGRHMALAVFVAFFAALTIFVISASYSQIVELFPTGAGGADRRENTKT